MNRMRDRVVAVTGASRGLGAALARALAAESATVAILARPSPHRDRIAAALPGASAIDIELADPASVRSAFAAIGARFGRLDGLVNNAAIGLPHLIEEASDAEIVDEVGANLIGPVCCIRGAIPLLRAAGGGDIVNISSVSVNAPFPMLALYAATKAALEMLGDAMLPELRPDNIRMATFRVGALAGDSFGSVWPEERRRRALALAQAAGRASMRGEPVPLDTVAAALVDLLALPAAARVPIMEFRPR